MLWHVFYPVLRRLRTSQVVFCHFDLSSGPCKGCLGLFRCLEVNDEDCWMMLSETMRNNKLACICWHVFLKGPPTSAACDRYNRLQPFGLYTLFRGAKSPGIRTHFDSESMCRGLLPQHAIPPLALDLGQLGSAWLQLGPKLQRSWKIIFHHPSNPDQVSNLGHHPPPTWLVPLFLQWYPWPYPFRALPPPPGSARPHRALSVRMARRLGGPGGSSQRWRWAAPAGHCHGVARVAPAPWDSKCRRPVRKNKRSTTRRRPGKSEGCLYLLHPVTMIEIPWFHNSSMFIIVCPWSMAISYMVTRRRKPPKRPLGELQIPRPCKSCWVMVGVW